MRQFVHLSAASAVGLVVACTDPSVTRGPSGLDSSDDPRTSNPPSSGPDAAPSTDEAPSETAICTIPLGKVDEVDGRSVYLSEVDLESSGTGAIRPSTEWTGGERLTIGYLAGSSGYSINARSDFEITSASPGTVRPDGSVADVREGDTVTFTVKAKEPVAGDAGSAGLRSWTLRVRMNPDPDYAKWTLSLYSFEPS